MGGSHYINYPCFWGVSEGLAKGQKDFKMGYIHMNAHLDFFEFPSIGKYHHANGCCHISKLDCVDISNMVWIGIRGAILTYESCEYIENNGGYIYTMDQVREEGVVKVAEEAQSKTAAELFRSCRRVLEKAALTNRLIPGGWIEAADAEEFL